MKNRQNISPPKLAERLLSWYAGFAQIEDLQGDLEEIFYHEVETMPLFKAKINYWKQVIGLLFSYGLKKRQKDQSFHHLSYTQNNTAMFRNYIKVAVRSLARNKFFTIINVLGLSFGMSVTILFIGFLISVTKYDKFHKNYENIYRVTSLLDEKTNTERMASSPAAIGNILDTDYTGIEKITKINTWARGEILYGNKELPMSGYFTDPNFFKLFSFKMLEGNVKSVLDKPYQMVMTAKAAQRLFSGADPIGKVVSFAEFGDFTVSGIMADIPEGSSLNFEILVSYSTIQALERDGKIANVSNEWKQFRDNYTYILLKKGQQEEVEQSLDKIAASHYQKKDEVHASFDLQPLGDIVLTWEDHRNDLAPYFGGITLYAFGVITLLILLPACFNYSNISISRAMKRAKEIGVRKVVGGYKTQIWYQFITETVIICLVALVGSIGIYTIIIQRFRAMLAAGGSMNIELTTFTIIAFVIFAIITGILTGIVPASYFSKIDPVTALKGSSNLKLFGKTSFKKTLIITQFTLSLFFIIGVVVQFRQVYYSVNYDLGFDQENLLDVDLQDADQDIFRAEFSKQSAVKSISMSSHIMGAQSFEKNWLYYHDKNDSIEISQMFVDQNYLSNLGLTLVAGTNFSTNTTHDENGIIINETFYKSEGITNAIDALDQSFTLEDGTEVKVIGVVKDFNYALLNNPISHFVLRYNPEYFRYANLKVNARDKFEMLSGMESIWKDMGQQQIFEAQFFDQEIEDAFRSYSNLIEIYGFLGFLSITIASLGLLGMVVYSTETRSKEVGVRKVMGASVKTLVILLSKEYFRMMMIAALIAIPISYLFFNMLLSQIQYYSVSVGFIDIGLGLGLLLFIGVATLASQTIRTAMANPVDTLRSE
ncbi:MAG TPA: ABC transporter permease [Fulvivirga sp.]|nr:ABC transporter permease [Fulvivirga sp.]